MVAVPDERLREIGVAFIRLKKGQTATEEEIINYCKDKIADIKVPRYVFFVEQFPLNLPRKGAKVQAKRVGYR